MYECDSLNYTMGIMKEGEREIMREKEIELDKCKRMRRKKEDGRKE